ncbi:unnamed protein product [Mucor hiemalis]
MGKKSHSSQKNMTEREDKHRPKTKAEKKLEHHEHKMKKQAKADSVKKGADL